MQTPEAQRIAKYFSSISRQSVAELEGIYSQHAYFKDPFNEVSGVAAIRNIFEHMFDQVDNPRFVILDIVQQAEQLFLTWDFVFGSQAAPKRPTTVRGASHLKLDLQGKIIYHRDYWDVAEELYEKVPLLGTLMRFLKRRLSS